MTTVNKSNISHVFCKKSYQRIHNIIIPLTVHIFGTTADCPLFWAPTADGPLFLVATTDGPLFFAATADEPLFLHLLLMGHFFYTYRWQDSF